MTRTTLAGIFLGGGLLLVSLTGLSGCGSNSTGTTSAEPSAELKAEMEAQQKATEEYMKTHPPGQ